MCVCKACMSKPSRSCFCDCVTEMDWLEWDIISQEPCKCECAQGLDPYDDYYEDPHWLDAARLRQENMISPEELGLRFDPNEGVYVSNEFVGP